MLCILYVIAVGTCFGMAGLLVERSLPPGAPRRWVWCASLAASMVVPPLYIFQHNMVVATRADIAANASWWVRIGAFDPVIMRAWGIVSLVLVAIGFASVVRVWYLVHRSRSARTPTVIDGVSAAVTDSLGPATVGLFRARVVVPRWVLGLPPAQRQYVLRHEEEHRRANDVRLLFASSILLVLTPWNIPLWWQLRRLSLAIEMDCDNRVVSALGDARTYGELLLNVAQATSHGPRLQPGLLGGAGSLERRLRKLLAPTQLTRVQRYLLPALAIAVAFFVLSVPHPVTEAQAPQHHSQTHATQR